MASVAFLEGYHYVPRIDKELLEAHNEGLICLSGCASGEFSEYILKDQLDEAREAGRVVRTASSARTSTSRSRTTAWTSRSECAEGAIHIANRLGLPLVATSDAHYLTQADAPAHDVLLCINTGAKQRRSACVRRTGMRYGSDQFYVRPPEEMYRLFPGHEDAVQAQPGDRRRLSTSSSTSRRATSPSSRRPTARRRKSTCASCATRACASATATTPSQAVLRPAGARTGHHLPDGLRQLFPHRRRLRALRRGERHPVPAPAARRAAPWSATSSSSATSIRWSTTCCSSASSTPTAPRRPTSTSTSARTAARR